MATTTSQRQERVSPTAEPPVVTRPLLVNVTEAARMLAIGRTAVYRLVWGGELTPIHIGKSVRFSVAQLEAFVHAGTDRPSAPSQAIADGRSQLRKPDP